MVMKFVIEYTDRRPDEVVGPGHFDAATFYPVLQLKVGQSVTHHHYRALGLKRIERIQ